MNILLYFALKLNLYSYGEFNYSNPIDSSFLSFINVTMKTIIGNNVFSIKIFDGDIIEIRGNIENNILL